MSTKKATKRALLTSILAICLCLVMLIGSTFAWFTDTASTNVNKIESGTLDVQLLTKNPNYDSTDANSKEWITAEGKTLDFVKAEDAENEQILWEPGCTYKLPELRIVNNGNLALKYKIQIAGAKDANETNDKNDLALLNVITWTYKVNGETYALETEKSLGVKSETVPGYDTLTIEGHMQETAGNDYQGLSINGIAITVLATQDTVEYDSNSNQYDKNALYGDVEFKKVGDQDGLNNAITAETDKPVVVQLPTGGDDNTFTLDNGIANESNGNGKARDITFVGDGTQTMDVTTDDIGENNNKLNYQRGSTFTFENLNIVAANSGNYEGIVCDEVTYKNCTITGKITLYGKATFINCKFVNENDYCIWTYAAQNVSFTDCNFTTGGKFINVYRQENPDTIVDVTLNNCKFINNATTANKAAVNIKSQCAWNVTINNCTTQGEFPTANNGLWQSQPDNNLPIATANKVTVDGTQVYPTNP